jgi:hypothetical protein
MAAPGAFSANYSSFSAESHQLVLLHGRRTIEQARSELEKLYPGRVAFVTNGGYFDTKTKVAVDLVVINNELISGYLFIGRPILAIGPTKDAIFTGKDDIPYRKWESYKDIGGFANALAGDNGPIEPTRKTNRQIMVVRNGTYLFIRMANANQTHCNRVLADCGLKTGEYMFLDGGSSMDEGATTTTQIGVIENTPPTDG